MLSASAGAVNPSLSFALPQKPLTLTAGKDPGSRRGKKSSSCDESSCGYLSLSQSADLWLPCLLLSTACDEHFRRCRRFAGSCVTNEHPGHSRPATCMISPVKSACGVEHGVSLDLLDCLVLRVQLFLVDRSLLPTGGTTASRGPKLGTSQLYMPEAVSLKLFWSAHHALLMSVLQLPHNFGIAASEQCWLRP